jgi:hypothetical protein
MTNSPSEDLRQAIVSFARATEVPEESFLMGRFALDDSEQLHKIIDGLTLSLISFCYHRHPRGENVHEVMEMIEAAVPGSADVLDLERRADDAAALQIPFIVTLNRLLEEYYELRRRLERRLQGV